MRGGPPLAGDHIRQGERGVRRPLFLFAEEVFIEFLEFYHSVRPYTDVVFDHEICQSLAVEEDDALVQILGELCCLAGEG